MLTTFSSTLSDKILIHLWKKEPGQVNCLWSLSSCLERKSWWECIMYQSVGQVRAQKPPGWCLCYNVVILFVSQCTNQGIIFRPDTLTDHFVRLIISRQSQQKEESLWMMIKIPLKKKCPSQMLTKNFDSGNMGMLRNFQCLNTALLDEQPQVYLIWSSKTSYTKGTWRSSNS